MVLKIGFLMVILYQQWAGYASEFFLVSVLFVYFGFQVLIRIRFNSNLSSSVIKFEASCSMISFWLSFMLAVKTTAGILFDDMILCSIVGLCCLVGYICCCFEEKTLIRLLRHPKIRRIRDPSETQRLLEALSTLYVRHHAHEKKATLLLYGYIERVQRQKDYDEGSSLLFKEVFRKKKDKSLVKYLKKENEGFLEYLSKEYLRALKK